MEYLSLYDFLGKAAGEKLGFEVKQEANKQEILTQNREITNSKFTGTVLLYPKEFLEFYFREPDSIRVDDLPKGHDWMGNVEDDDLPF